MKKAYIVLVSLFLFNIGCHSDQCEILYDINTKPECRNISFVLDSLVHYELSNSTQKQTRKGSNEIRGIDRYKCSFDSIAGLTIRMSYGIMSGTTFSITIKEDSLSTSHRSWGCTSHEYFTYKTIQQKLTINTDNFSDADSIIGHISYVGIQDVEHKIEQWESYGGDSEWLKKLKPQIAKVNGYFKFKIFESSSESSDEYKRSKTYLKRQFNNKFK